ncbi:MAG: pseudouridine synthase [Candidatus Paracaedibacteraceae bacterium]|nr:pseudouridine synthase [Candidatus Paracaedibacteraceae bacterium]
MTETTKENGTRLAKILAQCGVASRRQAEVLIQTGLVTVNGKIIKEVTTFVDLEKDYVAVNNKPITLPDRLRVWLYYKPIGVITTHRDPEGRPTVFDAAREAGLPHVVSVGRLDLNSEGLIMLTNQGSFAHYAESPKTGWERCYRVRVYGDNLPVKELMALKSGITIEGMHYDKIDVDFDEKNSSGRNNWLMITLTEGKNREIRKVMNHLGLSVNRLIRLSYGPFLLGNLQPGIIQEVSGRKLRELTS